jgi:hypothetical protein
MVDTGRRSRNYGRRANANEAEAIRESGNALGKTREHSGKRPTQRKVKRSRRSQVPERAEIVGTDALVLML